MIYFGKIVGVHGLNGDVKLSTNSDFAMERLQKGNVLFIDEKSYEIIHTAKQKGNYLLKLGNFTSRTIAEQYVGKDVYVTEEGITLKKGEFLVRDIIGLSVYEMKTERLIGHVSEVQSNGAQDLWRIQRENQKSFLIPYIKEVVQSVDLLEKKIYVELIEGYEN